MQLSLEGIMNLTHTNLSKDSKLSRLTNKSLKNMTTWKWILKKKANPRVVLQVVTKRNQLQVE